MTPVSVYWLVTGQASPHACAGLVLSIAGELVCAEDAECKVCAGRTPRQGHTICCAYDTANAERLRWIGNEAGLPMRRAQQCRERNPKNTPRSPLHDRLPRVVISQLQVISRPAYRPACPLNAVQHEQLI